MNSESIPGLSEYPDLLMQARMELRQPGACCGARQAILRKYAGQVQKRKEQDAQRSKIIPHRKSTRG